MEGDENSMKRDDGGWIIFNFEYKLCMYAAFLVISFSEKNTSDRSLSIQRTDNTSFDNCEIFHSL